MSAARGPAAPAAANRPAHGDYHALVERVRARVRESVPVGARVLVISRGDAALLRLEGREAGHFPQSKTGLYAGYHPADGADAAAHLTELRARGAEYLVIPATGLWWLDHYDELRLQLERDCRLVADYPATGRIYALAAEANREPRTDEQLAAAGAAPQVAALIEALLPDSSGVVLVGAAAAAVDVGERPHWVLGPADACSDSEGPIAEVVERAVAARSQGARYVVLIDPDRPCDRLDGGLRRELARFARPLCRQRLVQVFELGAEG